MKDLIIAKRRWGVSIAHLVYRMHAVGLVTDWQLRTLFADISRRGYRRNEPNSIRGEQSQVLSKVFAALREDGVARSDIAADLMVHPDEITSLVFGLVLTSVEGSRTSSAGPTSLADIRLLPT